MNTLANTLGQNIIGHQKELAYLSRKLTDQTLEGSYIFSGIKYLGKMTLAFNLASIIFCKKNTGSFCGHCSDCTMVQKRIHPDFYPVGIEHTKKEISVDQIRSLKNSLYTTSLTGSPKLAIIEDADTMNAAASNALLKVLEEPPQRTIIILLDHQSKKILSTITSRCERMLFVKPTKKVLHTWLSRMGTSNALSDAILTYSLLLPIIAMRMRTEPDYLSSFTRLYFELKEAILEHNYYTILQLSKNIVPFNLFLEIYKHIWHTLMLDKINNVHIGTHYSMKDIMESLELIQETRENTRYNIPQEILLQNLIYHA